MVEYYRKRKSAEEHEAVPKSRKPNSNFPTLDGSEPRVHAPISVTPDRQIPKHSDDGSLENRRRSIGKRMIADGKGGSSRPSDLDQISVDETMHESTDTFALEVQSADDTGAQDISEALTAAWSGSRLIDVSSGTSAPTFALSLQRAVKDVTKTVALRKNSTSKTVRGARTEFVCVVHATVRYASALRLQAGILRIVSVAKLDTKDCDSNLLSVEESLAMNEDTFRARMKALYQQYDVHVSKYCDSLWAMVRKMVLAYRFISSLEAPYAKRNENLVTSIIADLSPRPGTSGPNSMQTISQRQAQDGKLAELKAFHEIATICGGPGIFCLFPEKCLTK